MRWLELTQMLGGLNFKPPPPKKLRRIRVVEEESDSGSEDEKPTPSRTRTPRKTLKTRDDVVKDSTMNECSDSETSSDDGMYILYKNVY